MKVLIVTNIPNPYRIPLFNELNRQLSEKNISLKIAFGSRTYKRRKYVFEEAGMNFDYEFLSSTKFHFGNNENTYFTYSGLIRLVNQYKPDVIITNGFALSTVKLWLRSFISKTKFIIWTGAVKKEGLNYPPLRKLQRKLLMSRCSGYVVYGSKAREYLLEQGVPQEKISVAINTVDTDFFRDETEKEREKNYSDSKKHLTYVGYLVKRKKVSLLLDAIKILASQRDDFVLDIVGDGEDRLNLENFVAANKLQNLVVFHGFRQRNQLPLFLARSNCFLFQTDFDVWGLVLNEAMAAGLPCLSSDQAAASFDLIKDGETGFLVNFQNTEYVTDKINFLLNNPAYGKLVGKRASDFILQHASLEKSAHGFIEAITK